MVFNFHPIIFFSIPTTMIEIIVVSSAKYLVFKGMIIVPVVEEKGILMIGLFFIQSNFDF